MKLKQAFPNWMINDGIFRHLDLLANYTTPWKNEVAPATLDLQYYGNHSGQKWVSPLVTALTNDSVVTDTNGMKLAEVLVSMYGEKWQKLYDTLEFDYNPIHNYSMTETLHHEKKNTGDVQTEIENTREIGSDDVSNGTNTGTVENVGNSHHDNNISHTTSDYEKNTETKVSAFDSSVYQPKEKVTETENGTKNDGDVGETTTNETRTDNLAYTDIKHNDSVIGDIGRNVRTDNLDEQYNHTLTREGNIGVTTSQQMLESERNLWMWNYFNVVFNDIDSVITLSIY